MGHLYAGTFLGVGKGQRIGAGWRLRLRQVIVRIQRDAFFDVGDGFRTVAAGKGVSGIAFLAAVKAGRIPDSGTLCQGRVVFVVVVCIVVIDRVRHDLPPDNNVVVVVRFPIGKERHIGTKVELASVDIRAAVICGRHQAAVGLRDLCAEADGFLISLIVQRSRPPPEEGITVHRRGGERRGNLFVLEVFGGRDVIRAGAGLRRIVGQPMDLFEDGIQVLFTRDGDAAIRISRDLCHRVPVIVRFRAGPGYGRHRPAEESHVITAGADIGRAEVTDLHACGGNGFLSRSGGHQLRPTCERNREAGKIAVVLVVEDHRGVAFINRVQIDRTVFRDADPVKVVRRLCKRDPALFIRGALIPSGKDLRITGSQLRNNKLVSVLDRLLRQRMTLIVGKRVFRVVVRIRAPHVEGVGAPGNLISARHNVHREAVRGKREGASVDRGVHHRRPIRGLAGEVDEIERLVLLQILVQQLNTDRDVLVGLAMIPGLRVDQADVKRAREGKRGRIRVQQLRAAFHIFVILRLAGQDLADLEDRVPRDARGGVIAHRDQIGLAVGRGERLLFRYGEEHKLRKAVRRENDGIVPAVVEREVHLLPSVAVDVPELEVEVPVDGGVGDLHLNGLARFRLIIVPVQREADVVGADQIIPGPGRGSGLLLHRGHSVLLESHRSSFGEQHGLRLGLGLGLGFRLEERGEVKIDVIVIHVLRLHDDADRRLARQREHIVAVERDIRVEREQGEAVRRPQRDQRVLVLRGMEMLAELRADQAVQRLVRLRAVSAVPADDRPEGGRAVGLVGAGTQGIRLHQQQVLLLRRKGQRLVPELRAGGSKDGNLHVPHLERQMLLRPGADAEQRKLTGLEVHHAALVIRPSGATEPRGALVRAEYARLVEADSGPGLGHGAVGLGETNAELDRAGRDHGLAFGVEDAQLKKHCLEHGVVVRDAERFKHPPFIVCKVVLRHIEGVGGVVLLMLGRELGHTDLKGRVGRDPGIRLIEQRDGETVPEVRFQFAALRLGVGVGLGFRFGFRLGVVLVPFLDDDFLLVRVLRGLLVLCFDDGILRIFRLRIGHGRADKGQRGALNQDQQHRHQPFQLKARTLSIIF